MKKTLKRTLALLLVAPLLVGCTMKTNIGMKIESDKNLTINYTMLMDNEMIDGFLSFSEMDSADANAEQKTYTDAERWKFLEGDDSSLQKLEGYKVEKYDKDGFKGYIQSKEYGSLDEMSVESADKRVNITADSEDEKESDPFKGGLFIKDGNKYKSNMTIDLGEDGQQMSQYASYGAMFELKFVVELPEKPISNNATEVSDDGKTLTWDLTKAKDIDFEFELSDSKASKKDKKSDDEKSNTMLYVGIGAGVLAVLAVIVIVVVATSKKKNQPVASVEQPIQPTQPVEPMQHEQPHDPNQQQ